MAQVHLTNLYTRNVSGGAPWVAQVHLKNIYKRNFSGGAPRVAQVHLKNHVLSIGAHRWPRRPSEPLIFRYVFGQAPRGGHGASQNPL